MYSSSIDAETEPQLIIRFLVDSLIRRLEFDADGQCSTTGVGNISFRCCICDENRQMYPSKAELIKHLTDRHSTLLNTVKCIYCDAQFSTKNLKDFADHLKNAHLEACLALLEKTKSPVTQTKEADAAGLDWDAYFSCVSVDSPPLSNDSNQMSSRNKESLSANKLSANENEEEEEVTSVKNANNEEALTPQEEANSLNKQEENSKSDGSDKNELTSKAKPKVKKPIKAENSNEDLDG